MWQWLVLVTVCNRVVEVCYLRNCDIKPSPFNSEGPGLLFIGSLPHLKSYCAKRRVQSEQEYIDST